MDQPSATPPGQWIDLRVSSPPGVPSPPERATRNALDGVVIPVWAGDVFLAKACCASIRRFMGDIPITLLVDGPADTCELERLPGVSRMSVQEVATPEYIRLCSGSSMAKLLLFWASPYERFLCIDADTVVWGDVRIYAEFDKYDFIASHYRHSVYRMPDLEVVNQQAFDVEVIRKFDPSLEWLHQRYAICGVFFARRGVFSEARIMELVRLGCWRYYEQGMLNYLMWRSLQDGTPRIGGHPFQVFPAEKILPAEDRLLPMDWKKPVVVHWLGRKPKLGRSYAMVDEYRRLFLEMIGQTRILRWRLMIEDLRVMFQRHLRSVARRFKTPPS